LGGVGEERTRCANAKEGEIDFGFGMAGDEDEAEASHFFLSPERATLKSLRPLSGEGFISAE
jgi:hypothetical protein